MLIGLVPAGLGGQQPAAPDAPGQPARRTLLSGPVVPPDSSLGSGWSVSLLHPSVLVVHNTQLPSFGNDGALWAGRGINILAGAGVAAARASGEITWSFQLRPELAVSGNKPFFVYPGAVSGRSSFSSPWNRGDASIDLPLRFGDRSFAELHLGQSFASAGWRNAEFGVSTANAWWGPGRRNALLLSDNAPGFAHAFAGTRRPGQTPLGSVAAKVLVGSLTESRFFDFDDDNDARSISGAFVEFVPRGAAALTVGLGRVVVAPNGVPADAVSHALDFLTEWPASPDSAKSAAASSDQITSVFVKWTAPTVELYAEWARTELPRSLTDLLVTPHASQGYTLGLEWRNPVGPVARAAAIRLQAEFTNLEQTAIDSGRPTTEYYTGRATAHGFTHRGQLLGAAIGPGASSQFLAGDYLAQRWRVGVIAGRTRTENDAMYRQPDPRMTKHDVTVYSGIRGAMRTRWTDISGELVAGRRYNYLFQSEVYNAGGEGNSIDLSNLTLTLAFTPVR